MSTTTGSASSTYTAVDVEKVVRRVRADLTMIADSTRAWTPDEVADYVHDIELLAKKGYLASADVTLLSGSTEIEAVRFTVNTEAGSITSERPGGVRWPEIAGAHLRVVLRYKAAYDADARRNLKERLRIGWSPTTADTSHASLSSGGGRDYASNAFGMNRTDWTKR